MSKAGLKEMIAQVDIEWLQSLKRFFFLFSKNLSMRLGASLVHILVTSLILMAPF